MDSSEGKHKFIIFCVYIINSFISYYPHFIKIAGKLNSFLQSLKHQKINQRLFPFLFLFIIQSLFSGECVFLIHGLARTSKSFSKLSHQLSDSGYTVINIDYPSTKHPIDTLTENYIKPVILQTQCTKKHIITHSMGGILFRNFIQNNHLSELGHVVMLAPPNQGSQVVDKLKDYYLFKVINGPAGSELGTNLSSKPLLLDSAFYSLGVIAANKSFNWINSLIIPGQDDGKVSIASTKLKGMADHIIVPSNHTYIASNPKTIQQVFYFLKNGSFQKPCN